MVKLFRKNSNLCDHNPPTSQTDRRTTCDCKTALIVGSKCRLTPQKLQEKFLWCFLVVLIPDNKIAKVAKNWSIRTAKIWPPKFLYTHDLYDPTGVAIELLNLAWWHTMTSHWISWGQPTPPKGLCTHRTHFFEACPIPAQKNLKQTLKIWHS